MGSSVEMNDTLQLTAEQDFPADILDRDAHCKHPVRTEDVAGTLFAFKDKPNPRIFQLDPVRVYFVQNILGKWLFWGRIYVQGQRIDKRLAPDGSWKVGDWVTSGTYKIIDIYDPDYQMIFTRREAPPGLGYFDDKL
jgi:hypothetical protein